MGFQKVASEGEIPAGSHLPFNLDGENIAVYHLQDGYFATQLKCTHMGASLKKGKLLDGHKIQCPLHRARFDVRTGEVVDWANFPPGIQLVNMVRKPKALKTYPVKVENGEVLVDLG